MMTATMPAMPRLSARSRKSATPRPCFCGCGRLTKSTWFPGCDGVMTKWARRIEVLDDLATDARVEGNAKAERTYLDAKADTLALVPDATMPALVHTLKRLAGVRGVVDVQAEPVEPEQVEGTEVAA